MQTIYDILQLILAIILNERKVNSLNGTEQMK
jgi:hypothetical protein